MICECILSINIYYIRNIHILFVFACCSSNGFVGTCCLQYIFLRCSMAPWNSMVWFFLWHVLPIKHLSLISDWNLNSSHIHLCFEHCFIFCPNNFSFFSFLSHMFALKWQLSSGCETLGRWVVRELPNRLGTIMIHELEILFLTNQSNGRQVGETLGRLPHHIPINISTTSSKNNIANPHHERSVDHDRVHPHLESIPSDF